MTDDIFDSLSDDTKGIIEREGVPETDTHPFEMDNDEFAEWLADVLGRARGAELTAEQRARLRSIVEKERAGINQWLLNCWAEVLK